jgi:hypothetical protein
MLHNLELHLLRVCKILVEKLTITQPPRKFPAWYGTRKFYFPVHRDIIGRYLESVQSIPRLLNYFSNLGYITVCIV